MTQLIVYTARIIRTMNPSLPLANAVAVRDGRIVEVGTLETLRPWLDAHRHTIDETFRDHVLMPGFIDPHLHPTLAAVLLPCHFITAMEWKLPDRRAVPVKGHDAYLSRLKEINESLADPDEPLITWGFHKIWHGDVNRRALNSISDTRPIFVWQRSFHEIIANDAAIEWMGLNREDMDRHEQIDPETGRFFETGLSVAMNGMKDVLYAPKRFLGGLQQVAQAVHQGGHTTIGDMAVPLADLEMEWPALIDVLDRPSIPFRCQMIPRAIERGGILGREEKEVERVRSLAERSTHRLQFQDGVKLFTDGGFYAELMQLQEPGFIDGHHGEWLMPPEQFEALARAFWNNGFRIHVHCTGDMGLELALDVLEKLQWERPRVNHRFTIEHFGVSTPEQVLRIADLGALVSANVYYVHELADAYYQHSFGHERASQISRLGTVARHGIPFALHTDFTMAPALPLTSAWVAVNRLSESGAVMASEERISIDQAMQAITINAAYVLGMEHEIGSIRAGKKADFTVLEADPYETPPRELKDIPLWGTVFEGSPAPIGPARHDHADKPLAS